MCAHPINVLTLVLRTTTRVCVYCLLGTPYCLLMWAYSSTATPTRPVHPTHHEEPKKKCVHPKYYFLFVAPFHGAALLFELGRLSDVDVKTDISCPDNSTRCSIYSYTNGHFFSFVGSNVGGSPGGATGGNTGSNKTGRNLARESDNDDDDDDDDLLERWRRRLDVWRCRSAALP